MMRSAELAGLDETDSLLTCHPYHTYRGTPTHAFHTLAVRITNVNLRI